MNLTIKALKKAYLKKELTPEKLAEYLIEKAGKTENNVWIRLLSMEEIKKYTCELENKDPNLFPLYGIPFAVKDNIDLKGIPTTAGCKAFSYIPEESAFAVEKLIKAGAFPVGKTNMDQFATGLVGTRSPYGECLNSFNKEYISGGSSSGSAVAVATGLSAFSLGTDTAGSGRVPAGFNNIVGIKPTKGLISTSGVVPACRSLDCVSIFALNCEDGEEILKTIKGFDVKDPYSLKKIEKFKTQSENQFVFGIPGKDQLEFFGDAYYEKEFEKAVSMIEKCGGKAKEINFSPFLDAAKLLYEGPWVAERYSALGGFIESSDKKDLLEVTEKIINGKKEMTAPEVFSSMHRLMELKREADIIMETIDFLATPTAGTCYRVKEVNENPVTLNSNLGYYTNFMNLFDYCALAIPVSISGKLPFGITISTKRFKDKQLLNFGAVIHEAANIPMGKTGNYPEKISIKNKKTESQKVEVAVCGAHLKGLELHHQLVELGAVFLKKTYTSKNYRMFTIENSLPKKPGLVRDEEKGKSIEVEIYELSMESFGKFTASIPRPLAIGKLELENGKWVCGFIAEAVVMKNCVEIKGCRSWREFINGL